MTMLGVIAFPLTADSLSPASPSVSKPSLLLLDFSNYSP